MTIFLTPITRFSVDDAFAQESGEFSFGEVILRRLTDDELLQHFHISDRKFGPGNQFGCTQHNQGFRAGFMLTEIQEYELYRSTHAFVSQLPIETHQSKVNEILHCWRLLKMSRVACPVTYRSTSPGSNQQRPIECRLGENLHLDAPLMKQTTQLLPNIGKIPSEDFDLLDLSNEFGTKTLSVFLLVVIAERSLMKGDKNEISFKVSIYGSRFLEELGVADARDAYHTLRKAYDIRSAFAHSGLVDHADVKSLLPSLYEYVTVIRRHTALNPSTITQEGKTNLLFRPTN